LKNDIDVDDNGLPATVFTKALAKDVENAINANMGGQLSSNPDGTANVTAIINPDPVQYAAIYEANNIDSPNFDILQNGNLYIYLSMVPKGCIQAINVFIGFAS
jgi:hypothetical protein